MELSGCGLLFITMKPATHRSNATSKRFPHMVAQMLTQGTADGFPSLSLDLAQVVFFLIYKGVFPSQGC